MSDDRNEQIRRRAYGIWEALGRPEGGHQQHWTQAEAEILDDERGFAFRDHFTGQLRAVFQKIKAIGHRCGRLCGSNKPAA